MICLKISWIFILDPIDVNKSNNEFINCISTTNLVITVVTEWVY
jgi:hypothetical protein